MFSFPLLFPPPFPTKWVLAGCFSPIRARGGGLIPLPGSALNAKLRKTAGKLKWLAKTCCALINLFHFSVLEPLAFVTWKSCCLHLCTEGTVCCLHYNPCITICMSFASKYTHNLRWDAWQSQLPNPAIPQLVGSIFQRLHPDGLGMWPPTHTSGWIL